MKPRASKRRRPAASRARPNGNIFIYCDDPCHGGKVPGTNFYPYGDEPDDPDYGRWGEWYPSTATQGTRESGTTLVDDRPPDPGGGISNYQGREVRSRYRLECRKCGDRTAIPVREEKLFAVLNILAAHGVPEISFEDFGARLAGIST